MKKGAKQALELLSGLSAKEREAVLDKMRNIDPGVTDALQNSLVTVEDVRYLSILDLQQFLREIKIEDLGLALRVKDQSLKNIIYHQLPQAIKDELDEVLLGPPVPLSEVEEASERVSNKLKEMVSLGRITIKRGIDDPYV